MTKEERFDLFKPAISLIKDDSVKKICEKLIEGADEYFFHEPASSTGKYHPQYALGEGGLARHSMAVAIILNEMLRTDCYSFTEKEKDLLICAAIVHDIKKYGNGSKYTVKNHPELASKYVIDTNSLKNVITEEEAKFCADAIETHMGQWGTIKPSTDAQKLVHMADCLASRKFLDVNFDNPEINTKTNIIAESKKKVEITNQDPGEFIISFGKHSGKKLNEIDKSYVEWIVNGFSYKDHPVVEKAKEYLKKLNGQNDINKIIIKDGLD